MAVREASADKPGERAAVAPMSSVRLPIVAGVLCLVMLAVVLRLVPTVFAPSLNWNDEVFQTLEPAHRLVYGYGLVAWEFQLGMRSWLLPGALAGVMETARLFGDGPQIYLTAIAVSLGLLAAAPVVCGFLWCRRESGFAGAFVAAFALAVAPEMVYFGARPLNELVAAHLLVIGTFLLEPGYPVRDRRRLFTAGAVLAIVGLLRVQIAPAVAVFVLWSAVRWAAGGAWRARLPALIGGGIAALASGSAFDWMTLGYPLASVWRNLYYNVHLGISSGFSVEPWSYYLLGELGVWLAAAPLVLLLVAFGARRMPALLAAALAVVAVHAAVPHKEYRFIYPAVVLAMVLASVGLADLVCWGGRWLRGRGVRQGAAAALSAAVAAAGWSALALGAWSGGGLAQLRQRDHNELLAMAFVRDLPAPCGIGLYGKNAWVRYGGYTHLHRPVPMYWPSSEAALAAAAPAFDTLIYDAASAAPPPRLGFAPLRCFGPICVAQRAGRCEARPMPAMWFPEQLRDAVPAAGRFEALPARARGSINKAASDHGR